MHLKAEAQAPRSLPEVHELLNRHGPLDPGERAMMAFAEKVVLAADRITEGDIELLRSHGYQDEEIFDVAAAAAARCFFSKLLDALGVQADAVFDDLDPALRQALTVGRPVARPDAATGT
jgi:alkylhydroperoxidase family enzyme